MWIVFCRDKGSNYYQCQIYLYLEYSFCYLIANVGLQSAWIPSLINTRACVCLCVSVSCMNMLHINCKG